MEHKRVDRIIAQVKRHYQGEFSVNGDWQYSQRLEKRYQEQRSKCFNGRNGKFGLDSMLCTESCIREKDMFKIPVGGIVYGPYFAFAPGTYYACFELSGDLHGCALEISSPKGGIMASADASAIEKNGRTILEFSLIEAVDDLELKVLNQGGGMICFKSVTVKDQPTESADIQEAKMALNTRTEQAELGDWEDTLEEIDAIQIELVAANRENGRAAECALPTSSRLHRVKKLIRKVINCFVLFQVDFNKKITNCFTMTARELQAIVGTVRQLVFSVGDLKAKVGELTRLVEEQKHQLEVQQESHIAELLLARKLEERMEKSEAETIKNCRQLEQSEEKIIELKENFKQQLVSAKDNHVEIDRRLLECLELIREIGERTTKTEAETTENRRQLEQFWEKIIEVEDDFGQRFVSGNDAHKELDCRLLECLGLIREMGEHATKTEAETTENCRQLDQLWNKIREIDQEFQAVWRDSRDINSNLNSVWSTYHAFRQEVFYEIDSRNRQNGCISKVLKIGQTTMNPTIKSTAKAKIEQSGGKIRLNLGSGTHEVDGYLSVDARKLSNVDVVADVSDLPYEEGMVDEIFSAHLIEHFTSVVMERELLPYWYSLLKSGGVFRVIFPDMEGIIQAYTEKEMTFDALAEVVMGGQDYQLDYHYAVYSPERVVEMLKRAGFRNVKIVARNRKNGECREAEVIARK